MACSQNAIKNRWYSAEFAHRTSPIESCSSSSVSSLTVPSVVSAEEQCAANIACEYILSAAEQLHIHAEVEGVQQYYDAIRSNVVEG